MNNKERAKQLAEKIWFYEPVGEDLIELIKAELIKAELDKAQPWISVKDELPKRTHPDHKAQRFWCHFESGIADTMTYLFDPGYWTDNGEDNLINKVTHWMHLPEPPEGK